MLFVDGVVAHADDVSLALRHLWKSRLGDPSGAEVGVLLWFGDENHVVRLSGVGAFRYATIVPEEITALGSEGPPWYRGVVGAPKKSTANSVTYAGADSKLVSMGLQEACCSAEAPSHEAARVDAVAVSVDVTVACSPMDGLVAESSVGIDVHQQLDGASAMSNGGLSDSSGFGFGDAADYDNDHGRVRDAANDAGVVVRGAAGEASQSDSGSLFGDVCDLPLAMRPVGGNRDHAAADDDGDALFGGAGKRNKRRVAKSDAPPADASRTYFTPEVISDKLCLARVRNLGRGGQCPRPRLHGGVGFCAEHAVQGN